jgi:hypothetical protein
MIKPRIERLEGFDELKKIHEGYVPPDGCVAFVAREGEEIVGRIFIMAPAHVEGPWIREDRRGGLLLNQLVAAVTGEAKSCGHSKIFAYAASDQLADYLQRLGFQKMPLTVWEKEL